MSDTHTDQARRHRVWVCCGCDDCEPPPGRERSPYPCERSPSMDGAEVVRAEDYDRLSYLGATLAMGLRVLTVGYLRPAARGEDAYEAQEILAEIEESLRLWDRMVPPAPASGEFAPRSHDGSADDAGEA